MHYLNSRHSYETNETMMDKIVQKYIYEKNRIILQTDILELYHHKKVRN